MRISRSACCTAFLTDERINLSEHDAILNVNNGYNRNMGYLECVKQNSKTLVSSVSHQWASCILLKTEHFCRNSGPKKGVGFLFKLGTCIQLSSKCFGGKFMHSKGKWVWWVNPSWLPLKTHAGSNPESQYYFFCLFCFFVFWTYHKPLHLKHS